jgi:hypothetical protein
MQYTRPEQAVSHQGDWRNALASAWVCLDDHKRVASRQVTGLSNRPCCIQCSDQVVSPVGPVVSEAFNAVYELHLGRREDLEAFEIGSESPQFRSSIFHSTSCSRLNEFAQVLLQNRPAKAAATPGGASPSRRMVRAFMNKSYVSSPVPITSLAIRRAAWLSIALGARSIHLASRRVSISAEDVTTAA